MKARQVSKGVRLIALSLALLMPVSGWPFFGLVWVIADPMRDGNWSLKTLKDEIIHKDNIASWKALMELSKKLSENEDLHEQLLTSDKIRAKTTATSITQNASAEERYTAMDIPALVCAALKKAPNPDTICELINEMQEKEYEQLGNMLTGKNDTSEKFIQDLATNDSADPDDKNFLKKLADVTNSEERMVDYSLLNEQDHANLSKIIDFVTIGDVNTQIVNQVYARDDSFDFEQLSSIQVPLLLRSILMDNINRRKYVNNDAIDLKLINQGSAESHFNRTKAISDTLMTEEVKRHIALMQAANITQQFRKLKTSHIKQIELALKLKHSR